MLLSVSGITAYRSAPVTALYQNGCPWFPDIPKRCILFAIQNSPLVICVAISIFDTEARRPIPRSCYLSLHKKSSKIIYAYLVNSRTAPTSNAGIMATQTTAALKANLSVVKSLVSLPPWFGYKQ